MLKSARSVAPPWTRPRQRASNPRTSPPRRPLPPNARSPPPVSQKAACRRERPLPHLASGTTRRRGQPPQQTKTPSPSTPVRSRASRPSHGSGLRKTQKKSSVLCATPRATPRCPPAERMSAAPIPNAWFRSSPLQTLLLLNARKSSNRPRPKVPFSSFWALLSSYLAVVSPIGG